MAKKWIQGAIKHPGALHGMANPKWQIKRYGEFWLLRSPSHATGITYSSFDKAFAVLQYHLREGYNELSSEWIER